MPLRHQSNKTSCKSPQLILLSTPKNICMQACMPAHLHIYAHVQSCVLPSALIAQASSSPAKPRDGKAMLSTPVQKDLKLPESAADRSSTGRKERALRKLPARMPCRCKSANHSQAANAVCSSQHSPHSSKLQPMPSQVHRNNSSDIQRLLARSLTHCTPQGLLRRLRLTPILVTLVSVPNTLTKENTRYWRIAFKHNSQGQRPDKRSNYSCTRHGEP